jgi:DNA-binding transcriptional ArsR family regulator
VFRVSDHCDLLCLDLPRAEELRRRRIGEDAAAATAMLAKALADPTRLMLALALRDADGELCVCDLAWVAERSEKLVSHHVRQLRVAGLVRSRRDGKMVMYRLTDAGVGLLEALRPAPVAA